jgi:hypothetical protein
MAGGPSELGADSTSFEYPARDGVGSGQILLLLCCQGVTPFCNLQ